MHDIFDELRLEHLYSHSFQPFNDRFLKRFNDRFYTEFHQLKVAYESLGITHLKDLLKALQLQEKLMCLLLVNHAVDLAQLVKTTKQLSHGNARDEAFVRQDVALNLLILIMNEIYQSLDVVR